MKMDNQNLKVMVRGAYDLQKLRIQTGNRIVINFKTKLGQLPSMPESDLGNEEKKMLDMLRVRYKKITDGIVDKLPSKAKFKGDEVISNYTELCLLNQYFELEQRETKAFLQIEKVLDEYPIYNEFLKGVKGCGPAMSGVIISEIDISKAKYASSLWAYAGLDVAQDGRGRGKFKEHLVTTKYIDSDGNEQEKLGITFKPFLKTKLIGVLGGNFIKLKSHYATHYYNYKNRLDTDPRHAEKTKLHKHNMAIRYMIKNFLLQLYLEWRKIEGLEICKSYHEGKLGHVHTGARTDTNTRI